jgi:hypothetical protein
VTTFYEVVKNEFKIFHFLLPVGKPLAVTMMCSSEQTLEIMKEDKKMLWTISVVLVVLWLLGLVSGYTMGNFIHILLVVAIVVVLVRVIQGRRVL